MRRSQSLLYVQGAFGILGVAVGLLLLAADFQQADQALVGVGVGVGAMVLGLVSGVVSLVLASRIKTGRRGARTAIIGFEAVIAVLEVLSVADSLGGGNHRGLGGQLVGLAIALMVLSSMTTEEARVWFQVT